MFDEASPEYNAEIAAEVDEILGQNLIIDPQTNTILGSNVSPYKLYQTVAKAYSNAATQAQIKGQKATEQMLMQADNVSSAPVKTNSHDESKMTPDEYIKAKKLDTVWY